jgi:subtilisin family serine protease
MFEPAATCPGSELLRSSLRNPELNPHVQTRGEWHFAAAIASILLLWWPITSAGVGPLAPGIGVGPKSPRPKLNTLPTPPFVPGELIVKYRGGGTTSKGLISPDKTPYRAPRARVRQVLAESLQDLPISRRPLLRPLRPNGQTGSRRQHLLDLQDRRRRAGLLGVDVYRVSPAADVHALCRILEGLEEVEYARPNYTFALLFVPDDPFYSSADSWGQGYDDLYGPKLLQCAAAWDLTQGEGVVVAVADSGVDYSHPDLAANMWINAGEDANANGTYEPWPTTEQHEGVFGDNDGLDNDGNGYVDDVVGYDFVGDGQEPDGDPRDTFGHGTHVAGTIAAVGNNATGIVGIAPQARIMALKISADRAGGVSTTAATEAITYAVENRAAVGNHSWGGFGDENLVPTLAAAFEMAYQSGMVNVVAAGNANADAALTVPASFTSTIAVAATDHNDHKAGFSNYGLVVDVAAPGGGETEPPEIFKPADSVLSLAGADTTLAALEGGALLVGGRYLRLAGTSMASPHAAGVAALVRAYHPGATPDDVRARLKIGADPIDGLNPDWAGQLGAGRINALNSLTATPQPLVELVAVTPQGLVAPGAGFQIVVTVRNTWQAADQVSLSLSSPNPLIEVDPAFASLGALGSGELADNSSNPFGIFVDPSISFGEILPFQLELVHAEGGSTAFFSIPTQVFQNVIYQTGLPSSGVSSITLCMEDTDNDAYPDVLQTRIFRSAMYYRNNTFGSFAPAPLPMEVFSTTGMRIMDLNGDGLRDLLVPGNVPGQSYTKVAFSQLAAHQFDPLALSGDIQSSATSVHLGLDYNNDALADLMVFGGYRVRLFRNDGNLQFTEVTSETLPEIEYGGAGFNDAVLTDYDNDGYADVIATGGGGRGLLILRNQGDGTFEDAGEFAQVPFIDAQDLAVGDFDNDGWMDILAGDYPGQGPANHLLHNNGDGTFSDITQQAGAVYEIDPANRPSAYRGSEAFDFDNDGWLDIFVQCADFDAEPKARLYRNTGTGSFTNETDTHIRLPSGVRYTAAYDDYDNDGDVDIYLSDSIFGTAGFFRNYTTSITEPNHWVRIRLRGTESNADALGARVTIRAGDLVQIRDVTNGDIASQPVHFGLGTHDNIDEVTIRWPNGMIQRHTDQPVDTTLLFTEGTFDRGDQDGDGDLDLNDLAGFLACFGTGEPQCLRVFDFNSDGLIDLNDFNTFAVAYTSATYLLLDAGPTHTVYINRSAQFNHPAVSGGRAPYTYRWDPPDDLSSPTSPTPVASPLQDTVYTLTVTDADGRTASDWLLVRVLPMAVKIGDDDAIYKGESAAIPEPEVFGGIAPYTYSWTPPTGLDQTDVPAPTASPTVTTDYTLTVTDSADPPHVATDTIRIMVDGLFPLEDMADGIRGVTIAGFEDRSDFGASVAGAGDVNGDQFPDVIVGSPSADGAETDAGAAYVVFGGAGAVGAGTVDTATLDGALGFAMTGLAARDYLGATVAGLGDVNNDGFDDLAVAAPGADAAGVGNDAGAIYVVFGAAGLGAGGTVDLSALDGNNGLVIHGLGEDHNLGRSMSRAGDINDDGVEDFVVGAHYATSDTGQVGAAYVIFGSGSLGAGGALDLAALDGTNGFAFYGANDGDRTGTSAAAIEDFNGDAVNDLIIGADSVDRIITGPDGDVEVVNCGAAYLLFGGADVGTGGTIRAGDLDGSNGMLILGANEFEIAGYAATSPGDFNGNGYSDVVLGAPYADFNANNAGQAFVIYGGPGVGAGGVVDLLELTAADGFVLHGMETGDSAGLSAAAAGDVNNDGASDLMVGVPFKNTTVFEQVTGSVYVLYGGMGTGASGSVEMTEIIGPNGFEARGIDEIDYAGASACGVGDFNGDGISDMIIGAENAKRGEIRPGAAYVVFGLGQ